MANKAELSLRFLPVEALMELPEENPRRLEVEKMAALTGASLTPHQERVVARESRLHSSIEGKATIEQIKLLGENKKGQLKALSDHGIHVGSYARSMAEKPDFIPSPEEQQIDIAILRVGALGIPKDYPTTADIFGTERDLDENGQSVPFSKGKMSELDLNLCSADTAISYVLQQGKNVEIGNPLWFAMKPITGDDGYPYVFGVERRGRGLWLRSYWADPGSEWRPGRRVAFALPQVNEA